MSNPYDLLKEYPNLEAIFQGCISGRFSEWPMVSSELRRFVVEQATIKELLRVARCPDPNCDGNGSSWHAGWSGAGEPEQVQHECQWCDERTKALKEKT
jgi:hypothetical protein